MSNNRSNFGVAPVPLLQKPATNGNETTSQSQITSFEPAPNSGFQSMNIPLHGMSDGITPEFLLKTNFLSENKKEPIMYHPLASGHEHTNMNTYPYNPFTPSLTTNNAPSIVRSEDGTTSPKFQYKNEHRQSTLPPGLSYASYSSIEIPTITL